MPLIFHIGNALVNFVVMGLIFRELPMPTLQIQFGRTLRLAIAHRFISNLTVSAETPMGAGLFGCASETESGEVYIGNFIFENIQVSDFYPVGGAVGLQFMNCEVSDIALKGKKLSGSQGIDGARAGLNADGTTMSPIANCEAIGGSIIAEGNAIWGSGGGVYTDVVGDPACAVSVECQSEASIEAPSDAA